MNKFTFTKRLASAFITTLIITGISQNCFAKYSLAFAEPNEFEKEMREQSSFAKEMEKEREKESLRDKSHDNRIKIGENTSIGLEGDRISIRKTFLLDLTHE